VALIGGVNVVDTEPSKTVRVGCIVPYINIWGYSIMKTLIVLDRNNGCLERRNIVDFNDTLKSDIEQSFKLSMTHFGICWIEYDNYVIYTNYSNWQMFID
jgi:hypothetical protein